VSWPEVLVNKAAKIILILIAALGALAIVFIIAIFMMLPTPGQMGRMMFREKPSMSGAGAVAEVPAPNAPDTTAPLPAAETEKAPPGQSKFTLDPEKHQAILDSLLSPEVPLTDFCSHMNLPSKAGGLKSIDDFGRTFRDHFMKENGQDMAMDALLPLFRTMLRYPEMTELIELLKNSREPDRDGVIAKAEFYALITRAYYRLNSQRPVLEDIMDRNYHLFMLARAIQKKPELAKDPAVMDYCLQIQNATNESQPFGAEEERAAFTGFLEQSGVSASEIGYDSNYKTKFTVKASGLNIALKGGWMEDWLKSGQGNTTHETLPQ
jgi:hypothetical protein